VTGLTRRGLVVGGAGAVLFAALLFVRDEAPGAAPARRPARGAAARASAANEIPVVDIRLDRLQAAPGELEGVERNLFRFASRPALSPSPSASVAPARVVPPPAGAAGPPGVPAIPLRYIGLLEAPAGRVAVLSDGRGNVFYGREGDTIEGRYRVLQVNPVATELSYLDGRGRQTIRLSGQ
jgi:hypothetical protein